MPKTSNIDKIKNINFTNDLGWGYLFYVCNHINKNKIYFVIFEVTKKILFGSNILNMKTIYISI